MKKRKARKDHICHRCNGRIQPGEHYYAETIAYHVKTDPFAQNLFPGEDSLNVKKGPSPAAAKHHTIKLCAECWELSPDNETPEGKE